jgi:HD-like signal output (HDOD) protein
MRAKDTDADELTESEMTEIIDGWHANIGKAILETWGLPETLQNAVEHKDEYDIELEGPVTLTDVLISAKLLMRSEQDTERYPTLRRVGVAAGDRALNVMEEYAEELRGVRASLSEYT